MLQLHFRKSFAEFNVELDIAIAPSFTALFGPSGVGKTTTLNAISGLLQPSTGEIILNERVLFSKRNKVNIAPQSRRIGYIFQESRLFPHLSVEENLKYGLRRLRREHRRFGFDEIVEVTGVGPLLSRRPTSLSGGEKQRVALGRSILASPEYLLMDEPLAALDLGARLSFLNFIKELHNRFGLPILYVSHDLANVLNFAEQVIIMKEGRNFAYGPPNSLLDRMTSTPLVAREDISNLFEVEILSHNPNGNATLAASGNLHFTLPHIESEVGTKLVLNIPASEIILALTEPKDLSASNILPGKLTSLRHLGERVLAEVDAGKPFIIEIIPATVARLGLTAGMKIFLIIKASSFRRLDSNQLI